MPARRVLIAIALVTLAVTGLTACQTHVGLAASVDGTRLSDTDLGKLVQPGAAPYVDQSSGTTVVPKLFALEAWLRVHVIDATVARLGDARTDAETSAARAQLLGTVSLAKVERQYRQQGYTNQLADLVVDESATLIVLVQRLEPGVTAQQALSDLQNSATQQRAFAEVGRTDAHVSVSRRYGTWSSRTLSLAQGAGAGLPSFVQYATTAGATG